MLRSPSVALAAALCLTPLAAVGVSDAAVAATPHGSPSGTHLVVRDPAHDVRKNVERPVDLRHLEPGSIDVGRVTYATTATTFVVTTHLRDLAEPAGRHQAQQEVQTTLEWDAKGHHHLLFLVYDATTVNPQTGLIVPFKGCRGFAARPDTARETVTTTIPLTCFTDAGAVTASTESEIILPPRKNGSFGQNQLAYLDETRQVAFRVTPAPAS